MEVVGEAFPEALAAELQPVFVNGAPGAWSPATAGPSRGCRHGVRDDHIVRIDILADPARLASLVCPRRDSTDEHATALGPGGY